MVSMIWHSMKANKVIDGFEYVGQISGRIFEICENVGMIFKISGLNNIIEGPVVFVSNHMSIIETLIFPYLFQGRNKVTYVVKEELFNVPILGTILMKLDPIKIKRKSALLDYCTVIEEGTKKINSDKSVLIFPQSTRSTRFYPNEFNKLGIKLAISNNIPIIPIAIVSDCWGLGRLFRDFNKFNLNKPIHIDIGKPILISGNGVEEHNYIINYIKSKMIEWKRSDLIS